MRRFQVRILVGPPFSMTHYPVVRGSPPALTHEVRGRAGNPCGPTHVLRLLLILLLTIFSLQAQGLTALGLPHSLQFGMGRPDVQAIMEGAGDSAVTVTVRDDYQILSTKFGGGERENQVNQLRVFVSPKKGLFAVEEEIYLRWDHQQKESENLESHRRALDTALIRLRKKYGREALLEETPIGERHGRFQHVSATWQFAEGSWIHLIYEPQDWALYPELVKIVVVYRSAKLGRVSRRNRPNP